MRIGQCLGCKLMSVMSGDLCVRCERIYENRIRLKQDRCEVCDKAMPIRTVLTELNEVIDICRLCWEEMLEGDESVGNG